MTIATILPQPRTIFLDTNNNPLAGGSVYTYIPNTTTSKTTWQDASGSVANSNPIILDGNGSCLLYGSGQYTISVYDVSNNLIYTGLSQDLYGFMVSGNNTWTGNNTFSGTTTIAGAPTLSGNNTWTGQNNFTATFTATSVSSLTFTGANAALTDYEEGTWTPTDASGASLSLSGTSGNCVYRKIGKLVFISFQITYPSTSNGAQATIGGLPFTSANTTNNCQPVNFGATGYGAYITGMIASNAKTFQIFTTSATNLTNANLSTLTLRGAAVYAV